MLERPKFTCAKCETELPSLKSFEEYIGKPCDKCGTKVTEENIRQHLGKINDGIAGTLSEKFGIKFQR